MYLNQYWRDERLAFNMFSPFPDSSDNRDVLTLSGDFAEKIWVPDTFFANDKNRYYIVQWYFCKLLELSFDRNIVLILIHFYYIASCTTSLNAINWYGCPAMDP